MEDNIEKHLYGPQLEKDFWNKIHKAYTIKRFLKYTFDYIEIQAFCLPKTPGIKLVDRY
jgi:hypothetical protein